MVTICQLSVFVELFCIFTKVDWHCYVSKLGVCSCAFCLLPCVSCRDLKAKARRWDEKVWILPESLYVDGCAIV